VGRGVVRKPVVLAIIPARGGSKSVPRKNLRMFCGQPLIVHSINVARHVSMIDRCVLSTDDSEIAEVAKAHGAEVPFLRPKELAEDNTLDLPVFQHTLTWLRDQEDYQPDVVVHLRPTSPLRTSTHVAESLNLLLTNPEADSVRAVTIPAHNPFKMWEQVDGYLRPLMKWKNSEPYNAPRQELPVIYWQNGYVDVTRVATILEKRSMTGDRILPYLIDTAFPVDLDSIEGFEMAEMIVKRYGMKLA